jgi:uncharacterized protein (DUF305 family)
MKSFRRERAGGLTVVATVLCAAAAAGQGGPAPAARAYTAADVYFMSGMIHHHAQAVLMAGWAPSHGASASVQALCERIVVAQRDEIALMERWLRDRHESVPEVDAEHDVMPGMEHMMPGMLTAAQLAQLDSSRGPEFDRHFLRFMIQHHQGAITMVNQLFGSQGGGEEETVFRFASDVYADQTTEIDRMQKMLAVLLFGAPSGQ